MFVFAICINLPRAISELINFYNNFSYSQIQKNAKQFRFIIAHQNVINKKKKNKKMFTELIQINYNTTIGCIQSFF